MPSVWENKSQLCCKTDLPDQIDTNVLEHMAFSARHVSKLPQALFLLQGALGNRHRSYFPKGDHMLFGILSEETGLCLSLYWMLAPEHAVCLFPKWESRMWPCSVALTGPLKG